MKEITACFMMTGIILKRAKGGKGAIIRSLLLCRRRKWDMSGTQVDMLAWNIGYSCLMAKSCLTLL